MSLITIEISEEKLARLTQLAARLGISTEELARFSLEDMIEKPDEEFDQAARYVLQKNDELCRRLA
jgi:undecaprenyl pyrophosphate synthase